MRKPLANSRVKSGSRGCLSLRSHLVAVRDMWDDPRAVPTIRYVHVFRLARAMSSTLFNVLFAWKCTSTHHKLAMDALNRIEGPAGSLWRDLCLKHVERYLDGSKAPDNVFKDFRNHVLHVRENEWGGSLAATRTWYDKTVTALRERRWSDAVYAAGVLSHYYTDPIHPFHTGQSEAESVVHRALEWSIACAYDELRTILEGELGGWPDVTAPDRADWLDDMVRTGARIANSHYEVFIDHYDFARGVKNPPSGLDQELKDRTASLIGLAVSGYSRVMERALAESQAEIPTTSTTLLSVLAQLTIPLFWITKKLKSARERAIVEATYREFEQTGKVIESLSEDDATIRRTHAEEVRNIPIEQLDAEPPAPIGAAHGIGTPARTAPGPGPSAAQPGSTPAGNRLTHDAPKRPVAPPAIAVPRFYLSATMPIEKAPSIGAKTAALLERHQVKTVADLLASSPDTLAAELKDRHLDAATLRTWQLQASLCCSVPLLRGHDAQILVACGVTSAAELAHSDPDSLLQKVNAFVATPAGDRILRGGAKPDRAEVTGWIQNAIPTSAAA